MSPAHTMQSPVLVGRDDALALAERRIGEVGKGQGHLLMLAGEAGIGKSRLLDSILRKAKAAGFKLAKGDLAPQDRQVPLASVLDLARSIRGEAEFGDLGAALLALRGGDGADNLGSRRLLVRDVADRMIENVDRPTVFAFRRHPVGRRAEHRGDRRACPTGQGQAAAGRRGLPAG